MKRLLITAAGLFSLALIPQDVQGQHHRSGGGHSSHHSLGGGGHHTHTRPVHHASSGSQHRQLTNGGHRTQSRSSIANRQRRPVRHVGKAKRPGRHTAATRGRKAGRTGRTTRRPAVASRLRQRGRANRANRLAGRGNRRQPGGDRLTNMRQRLRPVMDRTDDPQVTSGLSDLLNDNPLSDGQAASLLDFLNNPGNGLSGGESQALRDGLANQGFSADSPAGSGAAPAADSPGDAGGAPAGDAGEGPAGPGVEPAASEPAAQVQTARYLRVANNTKDRLKVYLQYRVFKDQGWQWYPAKPAPGAAAAVYTLQPGETTTLSDENGQPIASTYVRIWAVADNGDEWTDNKDEDVWLVEEANDAGDHQYRAPAVETYTYDFSD